MAYAGALDGQAMFSASPSFLYCIPAQMGIDKPHTPDDEGLDDVIRNLLKDHNVIVFQNLHVSVGSSSTTV